MNHLKWFSTGSNPSAATRPNGPWVVKISVLETEYWLELLVDSGCIPAARMAELLDENRQLIAIFTTIDKNAKL